MARTNKQKKNVIQVPATTKKVKLRPLERDVISEISMIFELSKEEGELDHKHELEPKLDLGQRSSR